MTLLLITLYLFVPRPSPTLEPGLYVSNHELFTEIKISPNLDTATFYFPDTTTVSSEKGWSAITISPNYRYGLIEVIGNTVHFKHMESDFLPSTRPELKPMKYENNSIYLDCENMSEYLFNRSDIGGCGNAFIAFQKQ